MQIAIVEDGKIIQSGEHTELFSNFLFPVTGMEPQWMLDNNVMIVKHHRNYNLNIEKLITVDLYIENGEVFAVKVEPLTQDEINAQLEYRKQQIRMQRNNLLSQTDWTALTDSVLPSPENEQYKTYRQELRDITLQDGFPDNITWPSLNSMTMSSGTSSL